MANPVTLGTLYPNNTLQNTAVLASGAYTDIDEGISSADGNYVQSVANANSYFYIPITNMPDDFLYMNSLSINVRYNLIGRNDDTETLYATMYQSNLSSNLCSETTLVTNPATGWTNSGPIEFVGTASYTKTKEEWDNAVIRIRFGHSKSGGADGSYWRIDAIELTGTYTSSAAISIGASSPPDAGESNSPVFYMTGTEPDAADVEYEIQFDTVNTFDSGGAGAGIWNEAAVDTSTLYVYGGSGTYEAIGQSFTTTNAGRVKQIDLTLKRSTTSCTDTHYVYIRSGSCSGTIVATVTINPSTLALADTYYFNQIRLPDYPELSASTVYYITVERSGARDTTNYVTVGSRGVGTYSGGTPWIKASGSWTSQTGDVVFRVYVESSPLIDETSTGGDTEWYHDGSDTHPFTSGHEITYTPTLASGTYYWRARARGYNKSYADNWSTTRSLTVTLSTANAVPLTCSAAKILNPSLPRQVDTIPITASAAKILAPNFQTVVLGANPTGTITDTTPTFYFTGTDTDGAELEYEIQIDTANTFNNTPVRNTYYFGSLYTDPQLAWTNASSTGTNISNYGYTTTYGSKTLNAITIGGLSFHTDAPESSSLTIDKVEIRVYINTAATDNLGFMLQTPYGVEIGTGTLNGPGATGWSAYYDVTNFTSWTWTKLHELVVTFWKNINDAAQVNVYAIEFRVTSNNATESLIDRTSDVDTTEFYHDGVDTHPFTSGHEITYTVPEADALTNDTYYWRVRAKRASGDWNLWSSTNSFILSTSSNATVNAEPLTCSATKLLTPVVGSICQINANPLLNSNSIGPILVSQSSDDCVDRVSVWSMTTVNFIFGSTSTERYSSGALFRGINIPKNALIESAILRGMANSTLGGNICNARIYGEDNSSPATYSNQSNYLARTKTTAYTDWDDIPDWTSGTWYDSPNIKAPIQEIIDREDWVKGNNLAIIEENNNSSGDAIRYWYSYDGSSSNCLRLSIDYAASQTIEVYTPTVTTEDGPTIINAEPLTCSAAKILTPSISVASTASILTAQQTKILTPSIAVAIAIPILTAQQTKILVPSIASASTVVPITCSAAQLLAPTIQTRTQVTAVPLTASACKILTPSIANSISSSVLTCSATKVLSPVVSGTCQVTARVISPNIYMATIIASTDDATYTVAGAFVDNSGGIYAGKDQSGNSLPGGWRFQNVTIAKDRTILAATIEGNYYGASFPSFPYPTILYGEAADNPGAWVVTTHEPKTASTTSASVEWSFASFSVGSTHISPDIKTIIQEIVNRSGWTYGNSLCVIWKENGVTGSSKYIGFRSRDNSSTKAVFLTAEYENTFVLAPAIATSTQVNAIPITCSAAKILAPTITSATQVSAIPITCSAIKILAPSIITEATTTVDAIPLTAQQTKILAPEIIRSTTVAGAILTAQQTKILIPEVSGRAYIAAIPLTAQNTKILAPTVNSIARVSAEPITCSAAKILAPIVYTLANIVHIPLTAQNTKILAPNVYGTAYITSIPLTAQHAKLLEPTIQFEAPINAVPITCSAAKLLSPEIVTSTWIESSIITAQACKLLSPSVSTLVRVDSAVLTASQAQLFSPSLIIESVLVIPILTCSQTQLLAPILTQAGDSLINAPALTGSHVQIILPALTFIYIERKTGESGDYEILSASSWDGTNYEFIDTTTTHGNIYYYRARMFSDGEWSLSNEIVIACLKNPWATASSTQVLSPDIIITEVESISIDATVLTCSNAQLLTPEITWSSIVNAEPLTASHAQIVALDINTSNYIDLQVTLSASAVKLLSPTVYSITSIPAALLTCTAAKLVPPTVTGETRIVAVPITASATKILSPVITTRIAINAVSLTGSATKILAPTITGSARIESVPLTCSAAKILAPTITGFTRVEAVPLTASATKILAPSLVIISVISIPLLTCSQAKLLEPFISLLDSEVLNATALTASATKLLTPNLIADLILNAEPLTAKNTKILVPEVVTTATIVVPTLTAINAKILVPSLVIVSVISAEPLTCSHALLLAPSAESVQNANVSVNPLTLSQARIIAPEIVVSSALDSVTITASSTRIIPPVISGVSLTAIPTLTLSSAKLLTPKVSTSVTATAITASNTKIIIPSIVTISYASIPILTCSQTKLLPPSVYASSMFDAIIYSESLTCSQTKLLSPNLVIVSIISCNPLTASCHGIHVSSLSGTGKVSATTITASQAKIIAPTVNGAARITAIPLTAEHTNILIPALIISISREMIILTCTNSKIIPPTVTGQSYCVAPCLLLSQARIVSPEINVSSVISESVDAIPITASAAKLLAPEILIVLVGEIEAVPITASNARIVVPTISVGILSTALTALAELVIPEIITTVNIEVPTLTAQHTKLIKPGYGADAIVESIVLTAINTKLIEPLILTSFGVGILTASHAKLIPPRVWAWKELKLILGDVEWEELLGKIEWETLTGEIVWEELVGKTYWEELKGETSWQELLGKIEGGG